MALILTGYHGDCDIFASVTTRLVATRLLNLCSGATLNGHSPLPLWLFGSIQAATACGILPQVAAPGKEGYFLVVKWDYFAS